MFYYITHTDFDQLYPENKITDFICHLPDLEREDLQIALAGVDIVFNRKTSTELLIGVLSEACGESLYKGSLRRVLRQIFVARGEKSISRRYSNPIFLELKNDRILDIRLDTDASQNIKDLFITLEIRRKSIPSDDTERTTPRSTNL